MIFSLLAYAKKIFYFLLDAEEFFYFLGILRKNVSPTYYLFDF